MICQTNNEIINDKIGFNNLTDIFLKKKKYYFLEKNIDYELTHEPLKYLNKIMQNFEELKEKKNVKLEHELKDKL